MQMNINILLIIALALCLWRAYRGFRVGDGRRNIPAYFPGGRPLRTGAFHYGHFQLYGS